MNANAPIVLGRIVGVHGVRGWVKIHSDCRPREAILDYAEFFATHSSAQSFSLKLTAGRIQGKSLIAHFAGYDDRDHAMNLIGLNLAVSRQQLPATAAGEFYWADLIGLEVINRQQETLGVVSEIFETGANDVLVVKNHQNTATEILIPFVLGTYVDAIDLEKALIRVDWELAWLADKPPHAP